jgi:hypothetical protein
MRGAGGTVSAHPESSRTAANPSPPDSKRFGALATQQAARDLGAAHKGDHKAIGSRTATPVGVLAIGTDGSVFDLSFAAGDHATSTRMIALDAQATAELHKDFELAAFMDKALEQAPRPVPPALVGVLAERVRKRAVGSNDHKAAMLFKGLVVDLGHPQVSVAQIKPVLREILHESLSKDVLRTCIAIRSLCSLFPDNAMAPEWIAALLECAQSLESVRPLQALSATLGQMMETITAARPTDAARQAQAGALLGHAIATAVEPPAYHIGLAGWLQMAAVEGQQAVVMARVLRELDAAPELSAIAAANAIVTLTSMVVRHGASAPQVLTSRLVPLLKWAMARADGHIEISEAIAVGLTRASAGALGPQGLLAVVQALAEAGPHLDTQPGRLVAARLINTLITLGEPGITTTGQTPQAPGTPTMADATASTVKGDAQLARVIALATPLVPSLNLLDSKSAEASAPLAPEDLVGLEGPTLMQIGRALVSTRGGPVITAATLASMARTLVSSRLGDEPAGLLLYGMALAAGGAGMNAEQLGSLAGPMTQAGTVRGAALTCYLVPALKGAGPGAGQAHASASLRLSQAIAALPPAQRALLPAPKAGADLPEPLALGLALGDGPLAALRGSSLPRADKARCVAAACCAPDGLDRSRLHSEVLQCALLAATEVDLATVAAGWLMSGSGAAPDEGTFRPLRAALVSQILRQAASTSKAQVSAAQPTLAMRLRGIVELYSTYCVRVQSPERSDPPQATAKDTKAGGKPAADPRIAFLRAEAALLGTGPQAKALAPLVQGLRALEATLTEDPVPEPASGS